MGAYNFVHLHLHTKYSLLDGAIHIDRLAQRLKAYNMPAVAMTDHGNMFGVVDFYTKMRSEGIKPIIGVEAYIINGSIDNKNQKTEQYHIVLLAKDQAGYKNLLKLISIAYTDGFYGKPRINKKILDGHRQGLIALSACLHGEIPAKLLSGNVQAAITAAEEYKDIFKDDFFLEVQANGIQEQAIVNNLIYNLSKDLHIPLVATNDVHYLDMEDAKAHDVLLCIQTKKKFSDRDRLKFSTQELYLKTHEEMAKAFVNHPEALEATWEIANRCNLEIELGKFHFPVISFGGNENYDNLLTQFTYNSFEELAKKYPYIKAKEQQYRERLENELGAIKQTHFSSYFLIVMDIIDYANKHAIPIGPGRGSAVGSLVAYAIGITKIDPIKYGLYFERFLNKNRISLPDIDIDICAENKDRLIDYLKEKYGSEKVAQITTFHTLQSRAVVKDAGRVLDIPYNVVDGITKIIPEKMALKDAIKTIHEIQELSQKDEKIKEMINIALKLEGLIRDKSIHASGVVIADMPLSDYLPIYKDKNDKIVTGFEGEYVEKIGLIKFDLLSLAMITIIQKTKELIKQYRNKDIDLTIIDLNDPKIYESMQKGDGVALFQLESSGMQETLKKIKPSRIDDIIAVVAIFRPGPMAWIDEFARNKEKGIVASRFPVLNEILKETYGVILYQEQVMRIAIEIAGFSPEEADYVRKVIAKKEEENMPKLHEKFVHGAVVNGMKKTEAESLFDQLKRFAEYAFNKSHSAAYALVAVWTAYLKTYYTIEYMTAVLSNEAKNKSHKTSNLARYIAYCKKLGIEITLPDVNRSMKDFTIEGNSIRFGLMAIKNVGETAIDAILQAREAGGFTSLWNFLTKVDLSKVNRKVVESLIKAGSFDFTGKTRSSLFKSMEDLYIMAGKRNSMQAQNQLFALDTIPEKSNGHGEAEWDELEKLGYEKELLDTYISGTPLKKYKDEIKAYSDTEIGSLVDMDGRSVKVSGMITTIREIKEKKTGRPMAFITLSDDENSVEVVIFSSIFTNVKDTIKENKPVIVKGSVKVEEEGYDGGEEDDGTEPTKVVKIKAEEIFTIDRAAQKFIDEVYITADFDNVSDEHLREIKNYLSEYKGNARVYLNFMRDGKNAYVIELPDYLKIKPDPELFSIIKNLLGEVEIYFNKQ